MEHHMTSDDLDRRLRAARPAAAEPADADAFDPVLLQRVREQPIAPRRRSVPRAVAVPVAAGATLTVTAVVMLGGGPGDVGGPSSASAITQTLRWLSPPAGTVLHVRSIEEKAGATITHEYWQSADHPAQARELTEDAHPFEVEGDAFYDPSTDTIYDAPGWSTHGDHGAPDTKAADRKPADRSASDDQAGGAEQDAAAGTTAPAPASGGKSKPGDDSPPVADPIVGKVRTLLADGEMTVTGREDHNGTDAWAITLKPDAGRPAWTLWVSADDGKPLELRDPGRDASDPSQVIRWSTYEVLRDGSADRLVTLTGAHPTARVTHDPEQTAAAAQRLSVDQG
jgi:hypothetical protein